MISDVLAGDMSNCSASRLPLANHGSGANERALQDQQQAEHAGDDKHESTRPGYRENGRLQLDLTATGHARSVNWLDADMKSPDPQPGVESLDHAFCIPSTNRRRICIRGVQQELKSGLAIPDQVPRIVVRNHIPRRLCLGSRHLQVVDRGIIAARRKK